MGKKKNLGKIKESAKMPVVKPPVKLSKPPIPKPVIKSAPVVKPVIKPVVPPVKVAPKPVIKPMAMDKANPAKAYQTVNRGNDILSRRR